MKINKYFLIFSSLLTVFLISYLLVFFKYFLAFAHHTVSLCREMLEIISTSMPYKFGNLIFVLLSFSVVYAVFNFMASLVKIYLFRKKLFPIITDNKSVCSISKKLKIENKVFVLRKGKPVGFCFGIINPKIYLSESLIKLVNRRELEIILRHEKYHLDNRDNLIMLLAAILKSMFPYIPVLSDLIKNYKLERELNADRHAVLKSSDKQIYVSVLLKLIRYNLTPLSVVAGLADTDSLEARIKFLLNQEIPREKIAVKNILFSLISLTVFFTLTTTDSKAFEQHHDNSHNYSFCSEPLYSTAKISSKLTIDK